MFPTLWVKITIQYVEIVIEIKFLLKLITQIIPFERKNRALTFPSPCWNTINQWPNVTLAYISCTANAMFSNTTFCSLGIYMRSSWLKLIELYIFNESSKIIEIDKITGIFSIAKRFFRRFVRVCTYAVHTGIQYCFLWINSILC